jgi:hypothetical protein
VIDDVAIYDQGLSGTPLGARQPVPQLGEHAKQALSGLLGRTAEEFGGP